jgi:hypothetical protein
MAAKVVKVSVSEVDAAVGGEVVVLVVVVVHLVLVQCWYVHWSGWFVKVWCA